MLPDFSTHVNQLPTPILPAPGLHPNVSPALLFFDAPAPECGCVVSHSDEDDRVCVECESVLMAEPAELEPYPEELRRLEDAESVRFKEAA